MGATTSLSVSELEVAPGGEARTTLRVRNTGNVVDQFDMQILGDMTAWASIEPATVSLLPGVEEFVEIAFRPAKSSDVVAGRTPFAIKAASHEDPDGSSAAEGAIEVLPFDDRSAEIIPRTSKGRRSGSHEIAVDNRGNAPIIVSLDGVDPEGTMRFDFVPDQLIVPPGTAQFAKLKVTPANVFWRGPNKTRPFAVFVNGEAQPPLPLDGSMIQVAILPKWFWKAVVAALALIVLLAVLWFALIKPQIKTSAKEVVQPIDERLDAASIPELPTATTAAANDSGAGGGGGATTTTTTPGTETTVPTTTATTVPAGGGGDLSSSYGAPYSFRLDVQTSSPNATYTVPAGHTFALTDIVFQNPQGDTGRLKVLRDGDVLLELNLQNFFFVDEHTISPTVFEAGDTLSLNLTCDSAAEGSSECDDAATFSGFQQ